MFFIKKILYDIIKLIRKVFIMKGKIIKLIELFLLLSPLFDMLTAICVQVLNIDFTIGMIVRFLIMLIC